MTAGKLKGIVLAGGTGTRLYPATWAISKQLMPVYDKPMVYYPISTLMLAGVREILIIATPRDIGIFRTLLGDGSQWGVSFSFAEQPEPRGLAEAFIIGKSFIGKDHVAMILGDNLYYGQGLDTAVRAAARRRGGASVFAYRVSDPQRYGVVRFAADGRPVELVEKPKKFLSHWAVTGFYFYDNQVCDIAKELSPSARGELEVTDINRKYLEMNALTVDKLGRGFAWFDTGTHESLDSASEFVRIIEQRQGVKIGCPEEIAYTSGYISAEHVLAAAARMKNTPYGDYLLRLVEKD